MCRADVDTSSKPAHAWAPVHVRDCSVPKSMNEDTWHDDSCSVKPRRSRPSEVASPPTRCQKEPPFQMWRSRPPFAGSLAHTSGTSRMIVDHADNERTLRVRLLWKAHDIDVDVPRLLVLLRQTLDTRTRLVHGTRKRILWLCGLDCGSAGSGCGGVQGAAYQRAFRQRSGRMDV